MLAVVRWIVMHLFRTVIVGAENIPAAPFLIASNHQGWYDTAFVLTAFPALPMTYTMAKRETVFNRAWKRAIVTRLGVFPVSPARGELDARAVATVYQVLARGGNVLMFPEGRYSRGRALRPLKKGIAHFALQAGVPICPVSITGLETLRPFGRVTVTISPPVRPDPPAWWTANLRVRRLVDDLRAAILRGFDRARPRRPGRLRRLLGLRPRLGSRPAPPGPAAGEGP